MQNGIKFSFNFWPIFSISLVALKIESFRNFRSSFWAAESILNYFWDFIKEDNSWSHWSNNLFWDSISASVFFIVSTIACSPKPYSLEIFSCASKFFSKTYLTSVLNNSGCVILTLLLSINYLSFSTNFSNLEIRS